MKEKIEEILKSLVSGVDVRSTALVDEGYVTSITVVQLVSELDEAFGIVIDYTALSKENFQSVAAIAKMAEGWRKQGEIEKAGGRERGGL